MAKMERMFTKLDFYESHLSDDQLIGIVRMYSESLKVLRLGGKLLTSRSYAGLSDCRKLQQFDLIWAERFEDIHLENLVRNAPNLETLGLDVCDSLTDASVPCIHDLKKIQNLRLVFCRSLTPDALSGLGRLQNLRCVSMVGSKVDDRFFRSIACLKDLRSLAADAKMSPESFGVIWRNFENLGKLHLENCKKLTDAMGVRFRSLKNLNNLLIGKGKKFTNVTFFNGLGSSEMSKLCLYDCSMTDIGLASIAAHHRRLRALSLADCDEITDAGLTHLLRSEPLLQNLMIEGCSRLTDVWIRELETTCPRLQCLSLTETRIKYRVARRFKERRPSVDVFSNYGAIE